MIDDYEMTEERKRWLKGLKKGDKVLQCDGWGDACVKEIQEITETGIFVEAIDGYRTKFRIEDGGLAWASFHLKPLSQEEKYKIR